MHLRSGGTRLRGNHGCPPRVQHARTATIDRAITLQLVDRSAGGVEAGRCALRHDRCIAIVTAGGWERSSARLQDDPHLKRSQIRLRGQHERNGPRNERAEKLVPSEVSKLSV